MKLTGRTGDFFSALGGKILAGKKAKEDADRNRRRLEEAILVSRELGAQRIGEDEIKNTVTRLVFEADFYIAAALKSEDAYYEPLVLDALDTARAAVNAWKKNENEAAAGKYLGVSGMPGGIVIPGKEDNDKTGNGQSREKTLGVLRESLRLFINKNSIHSAGDPDAALADLADFSGAFDEKIKEKG